MPPEAPHHKRSGHGAAGNTSLYRREDNDVSLSHRLIGDGSPTIVITQMLGFASAEWWPLQDRLARLTRVLTWDRPGYGESRPTQTPRTVTNIAVEGLALIDRLDIRGPLLLVGHSQGGLYTQTLARLAPDRVSGVVLLDPVHPDNPRFKRELSPRVYAGSGVDKTSGLRTGRWLARLRLARLLRPLVLRGPPFSYCQAHPKEAQEAMWRHLTRVQAHATALAEAECSNSPQTLAEVAAVGPFPAIPLRLLVHDRAVMAAQIEEYGGLSRAEADTVEDLWQQLLSEHTRLSPRSSLHIAERAGHFIHLERPDWTAEQLEAALKEARAAA